MIGHYRLSESLENERWCVVESVIVCAQHRGLGKLADLSRVPALHTM